MPAHLPNVTMGAGWPRVWRERSSSEIAKHGSETAVAVLDSLRRDIDRNTNAGRKIMHEGICNWQTLKAPSLGIDAELELVVFDGIDAGLVVDQSEITTLLVDDHVSAAANDGLVYMQSEGPLDFPDILQVAGIVFDVAIDQAPGSGLHLAMATLMGSRQVELAIEERVELRCGGSLSMTASVLGGLAQNVVDCSSISEFGSQWRLESD
jgi:hypothetical protein